MNFRNICSKFKDDIYDYAPTEEDIGSHSGRSSDGRSSSSASLEPTAVTDTTVKKWLIRNHLLSLTHLYNDSRRTSIPKAPPVEFLRSTPLPRPELPPSPFPTYPVFDKTIDGNRLMAKFQLESKDVEKIYILRLILSLNSASSARFSSLTFKVRLTGGCILAILPDNVVGPETEAEIKDISHQASVSTSLQVGTAPVAASIGGTTFACAEHITLTRRTRGTIRGNGVGSRDAYWAMKEDSGHGAQNGLDPEFDLAAKLNVRPAIVSYEIVAGILWEGGKRRTIRSGVLRTFI